MVLLCGRLPNVYYQALSFEDLRLEPRFEALPPVERVVLAGRWSYRYVRQEDELWDRLHQGVLTTGRLAAALGFYERAPAKRLGLKSSRVSHGELLSAYNHLLQPAYIPTANPHISVQTAAQHNSTVVAAFNSELAQQQAQQHAGAGQRSSGGGKAKVRGAKNKARANPEAQAGAGAVAAAELGAAPRTGMAAVVGLSRPSSAVSLGSDSSAELAAMAEEQPVPAAAECQQPGLNTSLGNLTGMVAGGAVEALQPGATETANGTATITSGSSSSRHRRRGMKQQQQQQQQQVDVAAAAQPAEAGVAAQQAAEDPAAGAAEAAAAQQAPPGAPPDLVAAAAAGSGAKKRRRKRKQMPGQGQQGQQQASNATAAAAGPAGSGAAWPEEWKQRKARALSQLGLAAICCSWGKAQEGAALRAVLQVFPSSQLAEVGLCRLDTEDLPADWGFGPGSLPPLGASPDALIRHRPEAQGGSAAEASSSTSDALGRAAEEVAGAVQQQLAGLSLSASAGAPANGAANGAANGEAPASSKDSSSTESSGSGEWWEEIVEVKNACPFGKESRHSGRQARGRYRLSDRGPRSQVAPEWVPQLQLHMLCAGTRSGLLVSRSVSKGIHVFRMQRDDAYLRLMLTVASRLWQQHVAQQRPPAADVYASWAEHHRLLAQTRELASGAQLVAVADCGAGHPPGADQRLFLD